MSTRLVFLLITQFCAVSSYTFAQQYHYISTTEDRPHDIIVTKKATPSGKHTLTLEEYKLYSKHTFDAHMNTEQWALRDDKSDHDFVAQREGNLIRIKGLFNGEAIEKAVDIDEDVWFNKLDHGLSGFAVSDQEELSFWVLKLLSDLDPIKMIAEKEETERIEVSGIFYEAVKVKLILDHFILSKLWSARCWYRASDGLFLRYEGANGPPGTPVTVIELQKKVASADEVE